MPANPPDPTSETPSFRPLGDRYTCAGQTFRITKRIEDVAIAEGEGRHDFEVFIVQRNKGGMIGKSVIEPAEAVPAASKWGMHGWSYAANDRERAEAKFDQLCIDRGHVKPVAVRSRRPLTA